MARKKRRARQLQLEFRSWGGPRKGAGRKPDGQRASVSHHGRLEHSRRHPVHVTCRVREGLPSLRCSASRQVLETALAAGAERGGFQLVHYSIQETHLHLIVEADDRPALTRGVHALLIRVARALNGHWLRKGQVFPDRFHARALETPREVRNALAYVLLNARHHGLRFDVIDPYTSGATFDGWATRVDAAQPKITRPARTWLLERGWRRHGPIRPDECDRSTKTDVVRRARDKDAARGAR